MDQLVDVALPDAQFHCGLVPCVHALCFGEVRLHDGVAAIRERSSRDSFVSLDRSVAAAHVAQDIRGALWRTWMMYEVSDAENRVFI